MPMELHDSKIKISGLKKSFYGEKEQVHTVLENLNLNVKKNEFLVILGPGRCGKSVLIDLMLGLEEPTDGEISFQGNSKENIGVVFQKYALFPWKKVLENVEMGMKSKGIPKKHRRETAQKYLDMVGLHGFEKSFPNQLSGGMKQRVAIARAFAMEPEIMLLDEPFGALDAQTRYQMEEEILKIWEEKKCTVVFVTNNIEEAVYLGDRIILLGETPTTVKKEYIPVISRPRNYTDSDFLALRNEIAADFELVL